MSSFLILGIIASIFQLVILREFTFSIAKNELAFVFAAGVWLVSCSLGSLVGTRRRFLSSTYIPLAISAGFGFSVVAIHLAKSFFGLAYYENVSLGYVFLSSLLLVSPVSFLIGYSFCIFYRDYLQRHLYSQRTFAQFFAFEAMGFFIGGLIFTFIVSSYSNPLLCVALPVMFIMTPVVERRKKVFSTVMIVLLGIFLSLGFRYILKKELGGATILLHKGTRYGPVIVAEQFGAQSLYVNGSLVATSEDTLWQETFIHTSMSSVMNPQEVLFIGPYTAGYLKEILKHNVRTLDCVDINPLTSTLETPFITQGIGEVTQLRNDILSQRTRFIVDDPRSYLQKAIKKYDCIIMNMVAPTNIALNRYFSFEFFQVIKGHLAQGGVFCFYIPSKRDILSPAILKFDSCILNTLDKVFNNRLIIPGDSMVIIASDTQSLTRSRLIENFLNTDIVTDFFTVYHLKDYLDISRRDYVEGMRDKSIGVNYDLHPLGFLYYLLLEQIKFYPDLQIDIDKTQMYILGGFIGIVVLLIILCLFSKTSNILCNAAIIGFSSIGTSIIIFILFQTYSGALFWKLGILIGTFMMGLSLGTFAINSITKLIKVNTRALLVLYGTWICFLLSFLVILIKARYLFNVDSIFYLYSFSSGILTGAVYPLIAHLLVTHNVRAGDISAFIYTADLMGAFMGTLVFSVFFVPFLGILWSLAILIFLIVFSAAKSVFT